jgi:hypothetical protein
MAFSAGAAAKADRANHPAANARVHLDNFISFLSEITIDGREL